MKMREYDNNFANEDAMWFIAYDDHEEEGVDIKSSNFNKNKWETLELFSFKIYDDDDNLYYTGKSSCPCSFAPLDDFAEPNDGATYIKYLDEKSGLYQIL